MSYHHLIELILIIAITSNIYIFVILILIKNRKTYMKRFVTDNPVRETSCEVKFSRKNDARA